MKNDDVWWDSIIMKNFIDEAKFLNRASRLGYNILHDPKELERWNTDHYGQHDIENIEFSWHTGWFVPVPEFRENPNFKFGQKIDDDSRSPGPKQFVRTECLPGKHRAHKIIGERNFKIINDVLFWTLSQAHYG